VFEFPTCRVFWDGTAGQSFWENKMAGWPFQQATCRYMPCFGRGEFRTIAERGAHTLEFPSLENIIYKIDKYAANNMCIINNIM